MKKNSSVPYSEKRDTNAQNKVMAGYVRKYELTKEEGDKLHLFFSPWRVPMGMTKGEVRMIIILYKNQFGSMEWRPRTNQMTRSGFLKLFKALIGILNR